ncbi:MULTISPECIES: iron-containing alcohol dehydrogenase [unclassified Bosea (in: a-proteobacteria)]|uniref:iron-containing alcohol dehydrogenase n=1 Tax=unclassified Bosea (in: a-proteobacteria) TaxID=2653178 RepID=UPI000F7591BA|nr:MULTISPECIES: iron-containing alcohol dehydrogenase [unclassified Bosea (in: a-proteobacteria)]AZO77985.1 4-hydroxybutyrate dehydrogenase [Bosea sp. Tri-49]RXT19256.1 4-hydroxybutyrate dehydrogenase [Bosea sp. Tri-39]RXT41528.1 4-hydroxybutyrate dehydrogenase [Bosea sp. Tri-54]
MATISYLTTIQFGFGELKAIAPSLTDLKITRPLIVADRGLAATDLINRLRAASPLLGSAPLFVDTPTNPTEEAVEAAVALYREHGCDGLVAIGGGSPIDLAKGVALLASHDGPLETYAAILGGIPKVTSRVAPVIAVPTTAGTGSEVGRAALITLKDGRKLGFISPYLIPKLAICDPELTLGLPAGLTAATGMDALTHCIETYLSPRENPPAEAIALDGLKRAAGHIERATADGSDREARKEMLMAALQGGLTFQKGLGAVHALSHPLGGLKQVSLHHGTLNAVLLPAVLRFNESAASAKYAEIRRVLGLPADADLAGWIAGLTQRLGLPGTLAQMGLPREVLPAISEAATQDHSSATNARPASAADYLTMLEASFG